jgi:hypothetical protein
MKTTTTVFSSIVACLVIVLVSCAGSKKNEVVCGEGKSDTIPYVVFADFQSIDVYLKDAKPANLNTTEVHTALDLLKKAVDSHNNSENVKAVGADHLTLIDLKSYKVQLLPGTIQGDKWVYANCFCESMGTDWTKSLLMVRDGGKCYFQVRLNLTKGEYTDFMINGNG